MNKSVSSKSFFKWILEFDENMNIYSIEHQKVLLTIWQALLISRFDAKFESEKLRFEFFIEFDKDYRFLNELVRIDNWRQVERFLFIYSFWFLGQASRLIDFLIYNPKSAYLTNFLNEYLEVENEISVSFSKYLRMMYFMLLFHSKLLTSCFFFHSNFTLKKELYQLSVSKECWCIERLCCCVLGCKNKCY